MRARTLRQGLCIAVCVNDAPRLARRRPYVEGIFDVADMADIERRRLAFFIAPEVKHGLWVGHFNTGGVKGVVDQTAEGALYQPLVARGGFGHYGGGQPLVA